MVDLATTKIFSSLNATDAQTLVDHAEIRRFETNQVVFKEGESGDGIYVVKDGLVAITVVLGNDGTEDRRVLARIGPGDYFGEMAVLDSRPRSATASTEAPTQVYFIPRDQVLRIVERSPKFALFMTCEFSQRIRDFNRKFIQELLQAERLALVGRFARSIVHDFKNPLNVIRIASEMAAVEEASLESRKTACQRICKQVDRLSNMINELLEFTRGSHSTVIMAPANFGTFAQQLLEEVAQDIKDKGVILSIETPPPDVNLLFEPQRLSHVFYNLINNALDEMPDGGRILVRFEVENGKVVTEIEDTGSGIDPEIAPHMFEAFASHGKQYGTGLGLSICRRIMSDHRGEMIARNGRAGGAIFSFSLPIPKWDEGRGG